MNLDQKIAETMALIFGIQENSINEASSVDNISQWDSPKHMELVIALEEAFAIQFDDDEVANF